MPKWAVIGAYVRPCGCYFVRENMFGFVLCLFLVKIVLYILHVMI